jgi:hypothetical protein
MISPNFPDEKLYNPSLEDLIDVFEDRVRWWLLEPAQALAADSSWFRVGNVGSARGSRQLPATARVKGDR